MAKISTKYVCQECGSVSPQWLGKCPYCGKFGTLVEEAESPEEVKGSISIPPSKPTLLKDISKEIEKIQAAEGSILKLTVVELIIKSFFL